MTIMLTAFKSYSGFSSPSDGLWYDLFVIRVIQEESCFSASHKGECLLLKERLCLGETIMGKEAYSYHFRYMNVIDKNS